MYLVSRTIDGQIYFARALKGILSWTPCPNAATQCGRKSAALALAEGIDGEIIDVSDAAMFIA